MRKKYFSLRVSNFPPIHHHLDFWIFDISDICFALPLPSTASDHRKYQLCQHFFVNIIFNIFNLYCKLMEFAASCICIWRLCHYWLLNLHWLSKTESKYLYWTRRNTIFVPKPDTLFSSLADLIKTSSRKKTQRSHFREYFVFAFLSESEIEILSRRKWECWNNWPDWFNFKKRNTWPSLDHRLVPTM